MHRNQTDMLATLARELGATDVSVPAIKRSILSMKCKQYTALREIKKCNEIQQHSKQRINELEMERRELRRQLNESSKVEELQNEYERLSAENEELKKAQNTRASVSTCVALRTNIHTLSTEVDRLVAEIQEKYPSCNKDHILRRVNIIKNLAPEIQKNIPQIAKQKEAEADIMNKSKTYKDELEALQASLDILNASM